MLNSQHSTSRFQFLVESPSPSRKPIGLSTASWDGLPPGASITLTVSAASIDELMTVRFRPPKCRRIDGTFPTGYR